MRRKESLRAAHQSLMTNVFMRRDCGMEVTNILQRCPSDILVINAENNPFSAANKVFVMPVQTEENEHVSVRNLILLNSNVLSNQSVIGVLYKVAHKFVSS